LQLFPDAKRFCRSSYNCFLTRNDSAARVATVSRREAILPLRIRTVSWRESLYFSAFLKKPLT
jgi:hypothetical protein